MPKAMPRTLELLAVLAVVYPIDRMYAHFIFSHVAGLPFLVQPIPFLAVLLSFLVLVFVPGIKNIYARIADR